MSGLIFGPIGPNTIHLCVDMQRLFGPGSPWAVPWMDGIMPQLEELSARHAAATIFTRFIPPHTPSEMHGTWRQYYERWRDVTLEVMPQEMVRLVPVLERLTPPARVLDKKVYSPWTEGGLDRMLQGTGVDTLIVSGGETDVCVLGAMIGAVDRGYRVILAEDATCSSADETHDAMLRLYNDRYGQQIETAKVEEILSAWNG
ncbi:cysteine hydrolase family protein [Falsirhodobacter sp. 1013]|uniref:cysteine hydrolase family protein n=1 Tax=Falsirhodobacter sp. 1013 TaxID=3417566 RepID=UPI003EB95823